MTLHVETLVCGPIENNVFILSDEITGEAAVIDPSFQPEIVAEHVSQHQLTMEHILITHAHFDHFYGVHYLLQMLPSIKSVLLHQDDLYNWQSGGGAQHFMGIQLDVEAPLQFISDGEELLICGKKCEVRHAPGHSSGSVIYNFQDEKLAFVGDVIFFHGVGRTDLDDGNSSQLLDSIHRQVFTLPGDTLLYPGHGPATTVTEEITNNPFLQ